MILLGNIQGLFLTGLTPAGVELFENYVDSTGDIQTASLVLAMVVPRRFEDARVTEWVEWSEPKITLKCMSHWLLATVLSWIDCGCIMQEPSLILPEDDLLLVTFSLKRTLLRMGSSHWMFRQIRNLVHSKCLLRSMFVATFAICPFQGHRLSLVLQRKVQEP